MLKTPTLSYDPIIDIIAQANGQKRGFEIIEEGFFTHGGFNTDLLVWGRNAPEFYMGWPYFDGLNSYGVCDTPQQFINRFKEKLAKDVRTFCVGFCHVAKNPQNAGMGGGWRWHKWGPYIGIGEPLEEYLDDEKEFIYGVYVYHILQLEGPEVRPPWDKTNGA
jgi:hypothetical protein